MNEKELIDYGFVEVGKWVLAEIKSRKGIRKGVDFKLNNFEDERVIYAFLVDKTVKYIGICEKDKSTLKSRLKGYKYVYTKNEKDTANKIKNCLDQGIPVKIFALRPEKILKYNGLDVDLVKGLENPLIRLLGPEKWNIRC